MTKFKRAEKVILREIAGEMILVPVKGRLADLQRIYMLEGVAGFIWGQLERPVSEEEIAVALSKEFAVDGTEALSDARHVISDLRKEGLVAEEE